MIIYSKKIHGERERKLTHIRGDMKADGYGTAMIFDHAQSDREFQAVFFEEDLPALEQIVDYMTKLKKKSKR
jgi:hypothetical protein